MQCVSFFDMDPPAGDTTDKVVYKDGVYNVGPFGTPFVRSVFCDKATGVHISVPCSESTREAVLEQLDRAAALVAKFRAERLDIARRQHQAKIDAHHAAETLKHREELDRRAEVRAKCEAERAGREEKPYTKPGASGPERAGCSYEEPVPLDEQAREEVRKHDSIEAAMAHERALKEMEAMRIAELEEKAESRRKGKEIMRGE